MGGAQYIMVNNKVLCVKYECPDLKHGLGCLQLQGLTDYRMSAMFLAKGNKAAPAMNCNWAGFPCACGLGGVGGSSLIHMSRAFARQPFATACKPPAIACNCLQLPACR